jgi:hypothetical protein
MKKSLKWLTSQPQIGSEVVIFVNHISPSYHIVRWAQDISAPIYYGNDWDIRLGNGVYVGPRNFEGGCQYDYKTKDREFYWVPSKDFLKKVK